MIACDLGGRGMTITPTADDWKFASEIYAEFRAKPESQFIATRYALAYLSALVSQIRPQCVLEIGAGIGTVTKLLLVHPVGIGSVITTEAHEGCRQLLSQNLPSSDRLRLCHDVKEAAAGGPFDLVVLDSVIDPAHCSLLGNETTFFVEGFRGKERRTMEQFFTQAGKTVVFEQYAPGWRLRRKSRLFLGIVPKYKLCRPKGCFVGHVQSQATP